MYVQRFRCMESRRHGFEAEFPLHSAVSWRELWEVTKWRFLLSSCECGADIGNSDHKFCTSCGLELLSDEKTTVTFYFSRGFEYKSIIHMLSKQHGIKMSERTLKNRLKEFGLRRKLALYDEAQLRRQIEQEMEGPGCMAGYRSMSHTLSMKSIRVPRRVVEEIMRELDPEGCETRRRKRLRRRKYRAPGPNYCWHVDGYDKLKSYGFPIHGCIDGWSRKIMWLRLVRLNNLPETAASHFVDCVDDYGGCPVKLRTDCGTDNVIMAAMQCEFRQDVGAHIYGSSPANQRIEGWWSFYRRKPIYMVDKLFQRHNWKWEIQPGQWARKRVHLVLLFWNHPKRS